MRYKAFGMICYGPTVIQASALAYSLGQYPPYFSCLLNLLYIYFLTFFNRIFKAGSTQATRLTAARQIGEIAKLHPQDLTSLLKKVLGFPMFCHFAFVANLQYLIIHMYCLLLYANYAKYLSREDKAGSEVVLFHLSLFLNCFDIKTSFQPAASTITTFRNG